MGDCCRWDAFRFFTPLRCAQNDRGKGAAFRMTGEGMVYRVNFGVETHGQIIRNVLGSMSLRSSMVSCGAYVRVVFAPCVLLSIGGDTGGRLLQFLYGNPIRQT